MTIKMVNQLEDPLRDGPLTDTVKLRLYQATNVTVIIQTQASIVILGDSFGGYLRLAFRSVLRDIQDLAPDEITRIPELAVCMSPVMAPESSQVMEEASNTQASELELLLTFKNILETDLVRRYLEERQKSSHEPNTNEPDSDEEQKLSIKSVLHDTMDNPSFVSLGGNQDIWDICLFKRLHYSYFSNFLPSEGSKVNSSNHSSVTSTYVPQSVNQNPENTIQSFTCGNIELDHTTQTNDSHHISHEKWSIQPKFPSLWRLLWRYGLKFLDDLEHSNSQSKTVKNYIDQICNLINLDTAKESKHSGLYFVNDYQIVTPDGIIWKKNKMRSVANNYLQDRQNKYRRSLCGFKGCKECPYKTIHTPEETVVQHIISSLGALYHCVPCGEVYKRKVSVYQHAKYCPFRFRVAKHHDICCQISKIKRKKQIFIGKVLIEDLPNSELEFDEWISDLLSNIQKDGFLESKPKEELMKHVKEDIDHNFVYFFEQMRKKIFPKNKFKVHQMDDYYKIMYPKSNQIDPSKSAMFCIIEVGTRETVSLHRLKAVGDETLSFKDTKCHYEYCKCNQSYQNADQSALIGHILAENFLIVCFGCEMGFIDFSDFEKHINGDCFIKRKAYNLKRWQ